MSDKFCDNDLCKYHLDCEPGRFYLDVVEKPWYIAEIPTYYPLTQDRIPASLLDTQRIYRHRFQSTDGTTKHFCDACANVIKICR